MHVLDPDALLFLTCTENSFLFDTRVKAGACLLWIKRKKPAYLGLQSFFHGSEFPIHTGPLSKANCLVPLAFPSSPRHPLPATEHLFLHTKVTLTSPILLSGTLCSVHNWIYFFLRRLKINNMTEL
jgi:hypothetical protein